MATCRRTRDRNGALLERRKAASDHRARELAELLTARETRSAQVGHLSQRKDASVDERAISRGRLARWTLRALYWLAVTVVSLARVVGLILILEPLDGASVGGIVTIVHD